MTEGVTSNALGKSELGEQMPTRGCAKAEIKKMRRGQGMAQMSLTDYYSATRIHLFNSGLQIWDAKDGSI